MAAAELVQDDHQAHVEVDVTVINLSMPQAVANGNPARHCSMPSAPSHGRDGPNKLCSLLELLTPSCCKKLSKHCGYIEIPVSEDRENILPKEWWKTGVAFLYALVNLIFTTVVIAVVHERVPDKSLNPPLPDKFFDYVDRVPWAFTVTEVNGLILVGLWLVQWVFLKHKAIVGRRCFFLIGTLYMYRCVTMYVTTLPVPGKHMVCAPKLYDDATGKTWRILRLLSGGGLSLTGSHMMCGDFLYSGHTVMLTLSFLFIKEYSLPWMRWYCWFCWVLSVSGILCILIGHEHYSVDVVIAYFVTTRIFWWYHTMADMHVQRLSLNNYLSRTWWNRIFIFLEKNVQADVPVEFEWPVDLTLFCRSKYKMVEGGRDE